MITLLDRHSRIRDVIQARPDGGDLLLRHGYNLGEGFVDILSQYQTIDDAAREGRLREVDSLLATLNLEPRDQPRKEPRKTG